MHFWFAGSKIVSEEKQKNFDHVVNSLSMEWISIRLGGPAHRIVTKTVHKTLPGGGWVWGTGDGWGPGGRGGSLFDMKLALSV